MAVGWMYSHQRENPQEVAQLTFFTSMSYVKSAPKHSKQLHQPPEREPIPKLFTLPTPVMLSARLSTICASEPWTRRRKPLASMSIQPRSFAKSMTAKHGRWLTLLLATQSPKKLLKKRLLHHRLKLLVPKRSASGLTP